MRTAHLARVHFVCASRPRRGLTCGAGGGGMRLAAWTGARSLGASATATAATATRHGGRARHRGLEQLDGALAAIDLCHVTRSTYEPQRPALYELKLPCGRRLDVARSWAASGVHPSAGPADLRATNACLPPVRAAGRNPLAVPPRRPRRRLDSGGRDAAALEQKRSVRRGDAHATAGERAAWPLCCWPGS